MTLTHLKFIIRNVKRYKVYFLINVSGLAFGLALFVIIALYVASQWSFDRFNEKYARIYRMESGHWKVMASAHGPDAREHFPQVEDFVRFDMYSADERVFSPQGKDVVYPIPHVAFVANPVAWPAGYFAMRYWLRSFAYHIDMEWWIFVDDIHDAGRDHGVIPYHPGS